MACLSRTPRSPDILTAGRWHIPDAPAETHRSWPCGASLKTRARPTLRRISSLLRLQERGPAAFGGGGGGQSTRPVSKSPFSAEEVRRLAAAAEAAGGELMAALGVPPDNPVLQKLLVPATRAAAIAGSPFNIEPPTDLQPYFFLQVRPGDLVNLRRHNFGTVTEITFNGVRVMIVLSAASLALVILVAVLTLTTLPGSASSAAARRTYRWMTIYFLGIGLGYILVQLSLLQRLMIVLGRPTLALSVVLFSMLLGTGCGAPSGGSFRPATRRSMLMIVSALVVLGLLLRRADVGHLSSTTGRARRHDPLRDRLRPRLSHFLLSPRNAPTGMGDPENVGNQRSGFDHASVLAAVIGLHLGFGFRG